MESLLNYKSGVLAQAKPRSMPLLKKLVPLLMFPLYVYIIYLYGIIKGIIFIYVGFKLIEAILSVCFGLTFMRGCDVIMYLEENNNYTNCSCALILDKKGINNETNEKKDFTYEEFVQTVVVDKMIKKYKIFRTTVVEVLGFKLWKTLPLDENSMKLAMKQVRKIDRELKTEKDLLEYVQDFSAAEMPRNQLQWQIDICDKYLGDKAVMIGKLHHGLTDGMATMMLLASVDGNKNMPAIPQMKDISIVTKVILFLLSPFFFIHSLYVDLLVKNDPNPFMLKKGFTGKKKLVASKVYDFSDLRKAYKQFKGITFNDFFMGCIGVGFKKYAQKLGYADFSKLGIGVPVSLRAPPKSLTEKLTFQNCLGLGVVEFPMDEDLNKCMYEGRKVMSKRFNLSVMWGSQKVQLLLKYFPELSSKAFIDLLSSTGHVAVSNLPGLKKEITLGGYALKDTYFLTPHVFKMGLTILGMTYNGSFKFTVFQDQGVEVDAEEVLACVQSEIETQVRSVTTAKAD